MVIGTGLSRITPVTSHFLAYSWRGNCWHSRRRTGRKLGARKRAQQATWSERARVSV